MRFSWIEEKMSLCVSVLKNKVLLQVTYDVSWRYRGGPLYLMGVSHLCRCQELRQDRALHPQHLPVSVL